MSDELVPVELLGDLQALIEGARARVAAAVNQELVLLYWRVGQRIHFELLDGTRASYGSEIVATLSRLLEPAHGRGFSTSHFLALLPIDDPLARDFYAEMCRVGRWSVQTLRARIGGMSFQRTALSRKPDELVRQELDELHETDRMTPDLVFRDPYLLDFLGLRARSVGACASQHWSEASDPDGRLGSIEEQLDGVRVRSNLDAWLWTALGRRGLATPFRAPNATPHVERFMGSLRRECMNHFVFLSERHLRAVVEEYAVFYNGSRPHQGLGGIPDEAHEPGGPPEVRPGEGRLVGEPVLGGIQHDYRLVA